MLTDLADTDAETQSGVFNGKPGDRFSFDGCAVVVLKVERDEVTLGIDSCGKVDADRSNRVVSKGRRQPIRRRFRRQD